MSAQLGFSISIPPCAREPARFLRIHFHDAAPLMVDRAFLRLLPLAGEDETFCLHAVIDDVTGRKVFRDPTDSFIFSVDHLQRLQRNDFLRSMDSIETATVIRLQLGRNGRGWS